MAHECIPLFIKPEIAGSLPPNENEGENEMKMKKVVCVECGELEYFSNMRAHRCESCFMGGRA